MSGSATAKGGFLMEHHVCEKLENYETDKDSPIWIKEFGIDNVTFLKVTPVSKQKYDIILEINDKIFYCQIKSFTNKGINNQIDKRWVVKPTTSRDSTRDYKSLFNLPDNIVKILELFTGVTGKRKKITELSEIDRNTLVDYFDSNKTVIIDTIFKGVDDIKPTHYIVVQIINNTYNYKILSIEEVISRVTGPITITTRGNLKTGEILVKRNGGKKSNGEAAGMLQYQFNPIRLL